MNTITPLPQVRGSDDKHIEQLIVEINLRLKALDARVKALELVGRVK